MLLRLFRRRKRVCKYFLQASPAPVKYFYIYTCLIPLRRPRSLESIYIHLFGTGEVFIHTSPASENCVYILIWRSRRIIYIHLFQTIPTSRHHGPFANPNTLIHPPPIFYLPPDPLLLLWQARLCIHSMQMLVSNLSHTSSNHFWLRVLSSCSYQHLLPYMQKFLYTVFSFQSIPIGFNACNILSKLIQACIIYTVTFMRSIFVMVIINQCGLSRLFCSGVVFNIQKPSKVASKLPSEKWKVVLEIHRFFPPVLLCSVFPHSFIHSLIHSFIHVSL